MESDFYRFEAGPAANIIALNLPESLDAMEFDQLNGAILKLLEGRTRQKWVIDLTAVSYLGSAMLGLLVNIRQQIKINGGRLVLCGMSPRLLEIFRTCCMERLFSIVKDRTLAVSGNP